MGDPVRELPDASGTFTGTFDPDSPAIAALLRDLPELVPVEIDTYDKPNLAVNARPGSDLIMILGRRRFAFPVDHTEPLDGNRVRVWARRAGIREITADDG